MTDFQQLEVAQDGDEVPEFVRLAAEQLTEVKASISKMAQDINTDGAVLRSARLALADRYIKLAEVQAIYETATAAEDELGLIGDLADRVSALEGEE